MGKWIKGNYFVWIEGGFEKQEAKEIAKRMRLTKRFDGVRVFREGGFYSIYVSGELAEKIRYGDNTARNILYDIQENI
jgi:hypothetical protein